MKRSTFHKLLWLLVSVPFLLAACDDDAPYYGIGIDSEYNLLYSSSVDKYPPAGTLNLTYSDAPLIGKEVYFNVMTESTAMMKFFAVFPGEAETVIENVKLAKSGNGYTLSGSFTTAKNTSFTLSGDVKKFETGSPVMDLKLSEVKLQNTTLASNGTYNNMDFSEYTNNGFTYYNSPLVFEWKHYLLNADGKPTSEEQNILWNDEYDADMTSMLYGMISKILYLALHDVTFNADGNVTATYSPLPSDIDYSTLMYIPVNESMREPANTSPINLFTYLIDGDKLYLRPNIENIITTIQTNQSQTRANGDGILGGLGVDIQLILSTLLKLPEYYAKINTWTQKGMCFNFETFNPEWGTELMDVPNSMFLGDYALYLDKEEVSFILELLPLIMGMVEVDFSDIPVIGPMMPGIIRKSAYTSRFKVGMFLNKDF